MNRRCQKDNPFPRITPPKCTVQWNKLSIKRNYRQTSISLAKDSVIGFSKTLVVLDGSCCSSSLFALLLSPSRKPSSSISSFFFGFDILDEISVGLILLMSLCETMLSFSAGLLTAFANSIVLFALVGVADDLVTWNSYLIEITNHNQQNKQWKQIKYGGNQ